MKKKSDILKLPQWYRMVSYFDGKAEVGLKVGEQDVLIAGGDDDLMVALAPTSITAEQGDALRKILEANFRRSVLVLTNNIQLVKLRPIPAHVAKEIMRKGGADVLHYEKAREQSGEGAQFRAEDLPGNAGDLRSPGAGEVVSGIEGEGSFPVAQGEQGEAERAGEGCAGA